MPSPENRINLLPQTISRILEEGSTATLITLVEGAAGVGRKQLVEESGSVSGSLGNGELDDAVARYAAEFLASREETRVFQVKEFAPALTDWSEAQVLFERIQPEARLVICGAGHVGASLANLASLIGVRSTLIDDRAEFVTRERFPDERVDLVAAKDWFDAVRNAVGDGRGVSVAVVTRGHSEDEACMRAVMVTGADYVGLIGSRRRTRIVLERLREHGADNEKLLKVHAPIGLNIGAVTPEEVALAILAEIVSVRRGGEGGSLSSRRRQN